MRTTIACFAEAGAALVLGCTAQVSEHSQDLGAGSNAVSIARNEMANTCVQDEGAAPTRDPACVEPGRYLVTEKVARDAQLDGKTWERRTEKHANFANAMAYCEGLILEGLNQWRLPTSAELNGIRYHPGGLFAGDRHYCIPSLDQETFPDALAEPYWTSRTGQWNRSWYVGFDDGRSHWADDSETFAVRCVHD